MRHDESGLDAGTGAFRVDWAIHPCDVWISEFSTSVRLLEEQKDNAGPDGDFHGVSLVRFRGDDNAYQVAIVQWAAGHEGTLGRITSLDESQRVKFVMAVGANRRPRDFDDLEIIWRSTGVKMDKAQWKRNQNQSRLPDHMLRVLSMWSMAVTGGVYAVDGADDQPEPCFVCQEVQSRTVPVAIATRCCNCLLMSHTQCCEKYVTNAVKERQHRAVQHHDGEEIPALLPDDFTWPRTFTLTEPTRRFCWVNEMVLVAAFKSRLCVYVFSFFCFIFICLFFFLLALSAVCLCILWAG